MKFKLIIAFLAFSLTLNATSYFVAVNGDDSNAGISIDNPLKTIPKAISLLLPGDTIFVRGGLHEYSSTISISKKGTESENYFLLAYPGEQPILDFSAQPFGKRAISLTGNYWYIKGIIVRYAGDNGLNISGGGNNVVELCSFYENKDSGVQLGKGAHDNTFINCDSYYNADPSDYGDADGFAPKLDVGGNNRFVGCRAWGNCDDGWDGYMRGATNASTILENCWTWGNGYLKDGTDPGAKANGNGFKMGGGDNSNSAMLTHHYYLKNCLAFCNKAKGFDQNNNAGSMVLLNCTGFGNLSVNYRIKKNLAEGDSLVIKNCVSYDGNVDLGDFAIQATNSWMEQFTVTEADFVSIDTTGVSGPRKSDGSLPDVAFMKLAAGSDLIDSGSDVGLSYKGIAPDLGAFEFDASTSSFMHWISEVQMWFNGDELQLKTSTEINTGGTLKLYSISGQLFFQKQITADEFSINCQGLKSGIYIAELRTKNNRYKQKLFKR